MTEAISLSQTSASPIPASLNRRRVLVAEDDPVFRRVLQSWLRKWDYDAILTEDGDQAWAALQPEDSPKLVILDWMMPGMDGPEICKRLRACPGGSYQYLLLLTARDHKQDVISGLEAGADDYLTKPFDISELRVRLHVGCRVLDLEEGLIRAQEELHHRATHDTLTGIWNRGAVLHALAAELQNNSARGGRLGVLLVDIDHFKKVNDTYGHLVGDLVLRAVTDRLQACMRTHDCLGRFGGEEFLVVAPRCDLPGVASYGERFRLAVASAPIETGCGPIAVTVSIGAAAADIPLAGFNHAPTATSNSNDRNDPNDLLRLADEALYCAKAKGRNRVESATTLSSASAAR